MKDYWEGATYVTVVNIANEAAAGASLIRLTLTPGAGNEFEVLYGRVTNGDIAARGVIVSIDDGTNNITDLILDSSVGAAASLVFPNNQVGENSLLPTRLIVSGTMRLLMQVSAVADGEDATFAVALRLHGGIPARTTVGAGTEVVTVTTAQVF